MGSIFGKNFQNSDKYLETKYLRCDKMFVGRYDGHVLEFPMIGNKTVHDLGQILKGQISSMVKTPDNKL